MISKYTEADTSQCSLTEAKPGCGTSQKTGFLRLPPELRQKVYRELLGPFRRMEIQTNILRVSKRIHDEAVKIFYAENGFVMYHVHRNVLGQLRPNPQNDHHDFPSTFVVWPVTGADGRIGSEPALTISIALQHSCCSVQDSRWRDEFDTYVGYAFHMPEFCKVITSCHIRDRLHVRLSLPSVEYRTFQGRLDRLLDCFQECRGVGSAEIFDVGGLPVETDLSHLMAKPLEHFDEILTRARCYQDRVRQQVARRHYSEALGTLERACTFLGWWSENGIELSNETEEKWTAFWDLKLETSLLFASQSLHHGNFERAREEIDIILGTYPLKRESAPVPRRLWEKESEGHYIAGLSYLLEDRTISALHSFLKALISKPGHEKVDEEIDKIEAAIENSDQPRDEIARWNIKHVLEGFRHQHLLDPSLDEDNHGHRGPASMTKDDLITLCGSFVHFAPLRGTIGHAI